MSSSNTAAISQSILCLSVSESSLSGLRVSGVLPARSGLSRWWWPQPVVVASAGGDGEGEREDAGGAGLPELPGRDGHGPAGLDAVVDEQERAGGLAEGPAKVVRNGKRVPQRAQPLGSVMAARAGTVRAGIAERPEVGAAADLRD